LRRNTGSIEAWDTDTGRSRTLLSGSDFGGEVASLPGDRLIYSHMLGANPSALYASELLRVRLDGAGLVSQTPVAMAQWPEPIAELSASRTGKRILVRDSTVEHSVYVCRLRADGTLASEPRRITFGIGREDLPRAWARDSSRLLFDTNRYGKWEIFTEAPDGSSEEPLLRTADDVFSPRVSPDGASVLFIGRPRGWQESQPAKIMRIPMSGGLPQDVLTESGFSTWGLRSECAATAGLPCVLAQRDGARVLFRQFDTIHGLSAGSAAFAVITSSSVDSALAPNASRLAWIASPPCSGFWMRNNSPRAKTRVCG